VISSAGDIQARVGSLPEQGGGGAEVTGGMDVDLLLTAVGAGLLAILAAVVAGIVLVLRAKRSSAAAAFREEEYDIEGEGEDNFRDNAITQSPQKLAGDGVYGMATEGEPYISPDGVIYTRHEAQHPRSSCKTRRARSKSPGKKRHKHNVSKVSIHDQHSAGVEVRRMDSLSMYATGSSSSASAQGGQSIHEPIAKISMMSGLRKSKMKKKMKQQQQQQKQQQSAARTGTASHHVDEFEDEVTRMTRGPDRQVTRFQKGLGRGRSRGQSMDWQTNNSRSRSRSTSRQANVTQGQQVGRARSRSIDRRSPEQNAGPTRDSFETTEQRTAQQIQRSRSRSQGRRRQSRNSVPHIEPVVHESMGHRINIEIDQSRSRSGRSHCGGNLQRAPRQSTAEENPFALVGRDGATDVHREFETRQFEGAIPLVRSPVPTTRERPMAGPIENPNGVPVTITGKAQKHKPRYNNGQSRGAFIMSNDGKAGESAVLNSDLFTDSLVEDEEDGTEYTDISAISSRSIRSRVWEQMRNELAARQSVGMGLPMTPIHE